MAFVYILKSNSKQRYYVGSTVNLARRLAEHQAGKVLSTKGLLPLVLVFKQSYVTFAEARTIEQRLKRFKRKDFIEKIIEDGQIKTRL